MSGNTFASNNMNLKKALIVDDQSLNVKLINNLIQKYQEFDTTSASSASEALFHYIQEDWDVVFLDIMMPVIDGVTFLKIIDELVKSDKIAFKKNIIVCTSMSDMEGLQEICKFKSVKGLLRKPVSQSRLHNLLDEILEEAKPILT